MNQRMRNKVLRRLTAHITDRVPLSPHLQRLVSRTRFRDGFSRFWRMTAGAHTLRMEPMFDPPPATVDDGSDTYWASSSAPHWMSCDFSGPVTEVECASS